jgi:transposase InsO family protein
MSSVTRIWVAWELHKAGHQADYIAQQVGRHRSTIYRWLKGIRLYGIKEFVKRYQNAKKGHRQRKTHPYVEQRVLSIRREHHHCCGDKIVYWLKQEGIHISRSTVYRILNKLLELRPKRRKNTRRGPVPGASAPRQVIQMDTIDFGGVFAYTAIDIHTREGQVLLRPTLTATDGKLALRQIMNYFGPCHILQTDGGSEFEAEFAELLPTYADHHRIARPYKKNEQAFIERFNRTVRQECLGWGKYSPDQIPVLQAQLDDWLNYYHYVRPSMAFDPMRPPLHGLSHLT